MIIRTAREKEEFRARFLFSSAPKKPPATASFLVAIKREPIERIVAALAWWEEGGTLKFQIAHPPGIPALEAAGALVPWMEGLPELADREISHGRLLEEEDELSLWLVGRGYEAGHTERVFEAPSVATYDRTAALLARYAQDFPRTWRSDPIRDHSPDKIWPLLAPYQLIDLESLRRDWAAPGDHGFDPDLSNILFDGDVPLGVLLVRANQVCMAVEIRAVTPVRARLRSLANIALLGHVSRVATPTTSSIRTLAFRAREQDHKETANLALRMGGHEVAVRHIHTLRRPMDIRDSNDPAGQPVAG